MSPSFMDYLSSLLILLSTIWILAITLKSSNYRTRKPSNLPPGPYQLPIIGNILVIGSQPHQSLAELAAKYGPVMLLRLGRITTVVLSSPEAARAALQKHDLEVSSRTVPGSVRAVSHDEFSMAWLPVGGPWRRLRKVCREQMFSSARLDASQGLRREKLDQLRAHVAACLESGQAVNVGEAAFTTSLNLMSSTLFSVDFASFDSAAREMRDVVCGVMRCVGSPNLADYFPVLRWADLQGILRETRYYFGRLFVIFDRIIDDRMKANQDEKKVDLVEALIELNRGGEFSRDDIKHLLLDLFAAGTDTTSSTVEWAMAELLRNPDKLSRLKNDIKNTIGYQNNELQIQESDIPNLPYLQAVIKETFRLHPPAPLLVPHKAEADVEINGYTIPKNAQVLVNVWASGRDSSVWPNADKFEPERFLDDQNKVDFGGKDFELIPFGAGRRICPGLPLASRTVHLMLATLVGNFGWQLEEGMKSGDVDMGEKFGLTLQKAVPLMAVPTKL